MTILSNLDEILQQLKYNLLKAQNSMSEYANKKRREIEYQVGGQVFLKLCPYWQLSVQTRISPKLSPRFYGPFLITTRPPEARIHPVFHVSQLKKGYW